MYCSDGIVEFWENQRFWGLTWGAPLLPFDWPAWSDSQGNAVHLARPPEREGERSWFIVRTLGTDEEGWRYSTVFSKLNTPRPGGRASKRSSDYVRSRVWRNLAADAHVPQVHELQVLNQRSGQPVLLDTSGKVGGDGVEASARSATGGPGAASGGDGTLPALATVGSSGAAPAAATVAAASGTQRRQPHLHPEAERILHSAVAAAGSTRGRGGGIGIGGVFGPLPKPGVFKLWQLFMDLWNDACARHGMRRLVPLDPLGLYVAARRHRELLARQRTAQLATGRVVAATPVSTEVEPDVLDEQPYSCGGGVGGGGSQDEPTDAGVEASQQSAAAMGGLKEAQAVGVGSHQAAAAAVAAAAAAAAAAAHQHRSPTIGETPTGAAIMQPAAPQPFTLHGGGSSGAERRTASVTGPPGSSAPAAAASGSGDTVLSADQGLMPDLTDPATLLMELVTATNYARAAYGYPMAAGHLNSLTKLLTMYGSTAHFNPVTGASAEANLEAIHLFTGIPVEDVVMAEWRSSVFRPCHYLAVDRRRRRLVLAVRGSLEMADIATDLTARPVEYDFGGGLVGHVHQGLMSAACYVQLNTAAALESAAERFPGWPLLVTGHSLGAGVASLLTLLLQQRDRPLSSPAAVPVVHCLGIGPPAVLSANLAEASRSCIVAVINAGDFVARLSCYSVDRALLELVQASPAAQMADSLLQSTGATLAAIQQRLAALGGAAAAGVGGGLGGGFGGLAGGFGVGGGGGGAHRTADHSAPNLLGAELELVTAARINNGMGGGVRHHLLRPPPPSLPSAPSAVLAPSAAPTVSGHGTAGLKDIPLLTASNDATARRHHQHDRHGKYDEAVMHPDTYNQPKAFNGSCQRYDYPDQPHGLPVSGRAVVPASSLVHPAALPPAQRPRPHSADSSRPPTPLRSPLLPSATASDDEGGGGGSIVDDDDDDDMELLTVFTAVSSVGEGLPETEAGSVLSYRTATTAYESYLSAASSPNSRVSFSSREDAATAAGADMGPFLYRAAYHSSDRMPLPHLPLVPSQPTPHRPKTPVELGRTAPRHAHPRSHHVLQRHQHHQHHQQHRLHHGVERADEVAFTASGAAASANVGGVPYAKHLLQDSSASTLVQGQRVAASPARNIPAHNPSEAAGVTSATPVQHWSRTTGRYAALTPPATSPAATWADATEQFMAVTEIKKDVLPESWSLATADTGGAIGKAAAEAPSASAPRRRSDPLALRGPLHHGSEGLYGSRGGLAGSARERGGFGWEELGGGDDEFGPASRVRRVRPRRRRGGGGDGDGADNLMSWEVLSQKLMTSWFGQGYFANEDEDDSEDTTGGSGDGGSAGNGGGGGGGAGGGFGGWLAAMTGAPLAAAVAAASPADVAAGGSGSSGMTSCWPGLEEPPGPHRHADVSGAMLRGKYGATTHGSFNWPWGEPPLPPRQLQPALTGAAAASVSCTTPPPPIQQAEQRMPSRTVKDDIVPLSFVTTAAAGGGRPMGQRPRHRPSRSMPSSEMAGVVAAAGDENFIIAAAGGNGGGGDRGDGAAAGGGGGGGTAPSVPHYLHSANKELFPPGRLLWMVVDDIDSVPLAARQKLFSCQNKRDTRDMSCATPTCEGASTATAAAAAPSSPVEGPAAVAEVTTPCSDAWGISSAAPRAVQASCETCYSKGYEQQEQPQCLPKHDHRQRHDQQRVQQQRAVAKPFSHEEEGEEKETDPEGYSLLDVSLVTDLMQGMATGPGTLHSGRAGDGSGRMEERYSGGPGAGDTDPEGGATHPAIEPPVELEASRLQATATPAAASVDRRLASKGTGGTDDAGMSRNFVRQHVGDVVDDLTRVQEAVVVEGSVTSRQRSSSSRWRSSKSGGPGNEDLDSDNDDEESRMSTLLPLPAAVDACVTSVAVAVSGVPSGGRGRGGGSGGGSDGSGGGGGGGPSSTPFAARVREGLKRLRSGVETMLRQAPLPQVPSISFLQAVAQTSQSAAAVALGRGGGSCDGATDDSDEPLLPGSTAAGPTGQEQVTHGSAGQTGGVAPPTPPQGQWLFLVEADREIFDRMILIPASVTDHLPDNYFQRLRQLSKGAAAAVATAAAASTGRGGSSRDVAASSGL